jgi:hypothetical protein
MRNACLIPVQEIAKNMILGFWSQVNASISRTIPPFIGESRRGWANYINENAVNRYLQYFITYYG